MRLRGKGGERVKGILAGLFLSLLAHGALAQKIQSRLGEPALIAVPVAFDQVKVQSNTPGLLYRRVKGRVKKEYGLKEDELSGKLIGRIGQVPVIDQLPVTLAEVSYEYEVRHSSGSILAVTETSRKWPEELFPSVILPEHPGWVALYKKAWELNWERIVTSTALPARFAYNATPDNSMSYVWDACFNLLFQRYAAMSRADAGVATLDNFYAIQNEEGYIDRHFNTSTFAAGYLTSHDTASITGVNPPLFAWAEWDYYLMTADKGRLTSLLPKLIKQYQFIESFLQEKPGYYIWDGNPSGWDNILEIQPHKYWVELPAMQALSARCISQIADELGNNDVAARFKTELSGKQQQMEAYWNKEKNWYCSIDSNGRFTGKTLSGLWAVAAGIVTQDRAALIRQTIMDTTAFLTSPMPLPSVAKDEHGYDPQGRYWHGSVWINISLMAIRGLEQYGFVNEAKQLSTQTLNGMLQVYEQWDKRPFTLWECYAPEFIAPASHKFKPGLGSVRTDFADWTSCLINLLIENVMGIQVNAPQRLLTWDLRLKEEHGLRNLRFGDVVTDLFIKDSSVFVTSNKSYNIKILSGSEIHDLKVKPGDNVFKVKISSWAIEKR
jgi:hypothetical protein